MKCELSIDGRPFSFDVEGEFFWGKDEVIFEAKNNVIENVEWRDVGYNSLDVLESREHEILVETVTNLIRKIFDQIGVKYDQNNFRLEDYHKYITDGAVHNQIIQQTRFFRYSDFPKSIFDKIASKISRDLNKEVCFENPLLEKEIVILRISRPNSLDINPPHRDGYLDVWKNILNLWLPVVGCDQNSSLPIIPKSHLWNEKDIFRTANKGASINGLSYHVPGIVKSNHGLNMIRPNPKVGQALIFTPFLIHGAAINCNQDHTRMSLELRLCRKDS